MKITWNKSLKNTNTFHLDVKSQQHVLIETVEDIESGKLLSFYGDIPRYILGQGSNVLLLEDVDVPVLQLATRGWEVVEQNDDDSVVVTIQGGQDWHTFVMAMAEEGYWGVENLALIPGTVGAAPIQNIGAYGVELVDVFEYCDTIDLLTGTLVRFDKSMCQLSYRDSFFKQQAALASHRYLIYQVTLRLSKVPQPRLNYGDVQKYVLELIDTLQDVTPGVVAHVIMQIRRKTLPDWTVLGCVGSFFKNPVVSVNAFNVFNSKWPYAPNYPADEGVKIPAGWLIEQAGWKGHKETDNDAGVYENHALVIVNHGTATGDDIQALANKIKTSVYEMFGIIIEQEVNSFP